MPVSEAIASLVRRVMDLEERLDRRTDAARRIADYELGRSTGRVGLPAGGVASWVSAEHSA